MHINAGYIFPRGSDTSWISLLVHQPLPWLQTHKNSSDFQMGYIYMGYIPKYEDLFSTEMDKVEVIGRILLQKFQLLHRAQLVQASAAT